MFFSNKKNIFKNNINNSIFTKGRKVKSKNNLLFIKILNRFHLNIKPVRDNKSQLYSNCQNYKNARTCKNFSLTLICIAMFRIIKVQELAKILVWREKYDC